MELMLGALQPGAAIPDVRWLPPTPAASLTPITATGVTSDWRQMLPVLCGEHMVLRELQMRDAAALLTLLTAEEVARFISPPPTTVDGFEKFIAWTHRERQAGRYACFAVVPKGCDHAVGLFQIRALVADWSLAEWGFAIGSAFWGRGLFPAGAALTLSFAFEHVGVHRLEARAAVPNGRGNGALRKIGARLEGTLRKSFLRRGERLDQALWSVLAEDWRRQNGLWVH
jgi:RimJ/RimL family protein N-acetyltransferase